MVPELMSRINNEKRKEQRTVEEVLPETKANKKLPKKIKLRNKATAKGNKFGPGLPK